MSGQSLPDLTKTSTLENPCRWRGKGRRSDLVVVVAVDFNVQLFGSHLSALIATSKQAQANGGVDNLLIIPTKKSPKRHACMTSHGVIRSSRILLI